MLSDLRLAELSAEAYAVAPVWSNGAIHAVARAIDEETVAVAFRGSACLEDWWRDFDAVPHEVREHPQLGPCHAGFLGDVESLFDAMRRDLAGKALVVAGHSKGGGEALIFAALMVIAGQAPVEVATFGAPRAGFAGLGRVLAAVKSVRQFRRGNDPVPEVPFLPTGYRHARALIEIGGRAIIPIEAHGIAGYVTALRGEPNHGP